MTQTTGTTSQEVTVGAMRALTVKVAKDDSLKQVVTNHDSYACRKVILACGLLHFPRKLPVLDELNSKKVYYKIPKIGDYEGSRVAVVGGGDSALDAAAMVLARHGEVDLIVRGEKPSGKAETLEATLSKSPPGRSPNPVITFFSQRNASVPDAAKLNPTTIKPSVDTPWAAL